jgi:microcompartment protein CcmK/EutM
MTEATKDAPIDAVIMAIIDDLQITHTMQGRQ